MEEVRRKRSDGLGAGEQIMQKLIGIVRALTWTLR